MSKEMRKCALAVIGVILGWVMIVPAFEFPDEQAHLGSVSYLISNGRMPGYKANDLTIEMEKTQKLLGIFRDGNGNNLYTYHPDHHVVYNNGLIGLYESEIISLNSPENRGIYVGSEAAKYPPLYYGYISLFTRMANQSDILTRLYISRLGGLTIAVCMSLLVWQIGLIVFEQKIYAKTLVILVMLQPMISFVTAGVNSDNLHNLLFLYLIYLGLRIIKTGFTWTLAFFTAIACLADIATKPQGFLTILLLVCTLIFVTIKDHRWKLLAISTIGFIFILIFTKSFWLGYLDFENPSNASLVEYLQFTSNKLLAQNVVWYWGVFKWLGVVLPPIYWRVANRIVLISVVGILVYWWKIIRKPIQNSFADPTSIAYLIFVLLFYTIAIFLADWQHVRHVGYSLGIQARYFFPTIVAQMTLLLTGITAIGWNKHSRKWLRRLLILLFFWLQLGGIWRIITIYYPGTSLSEIIAQASQYKPIFAKGNWWYLWGSVYIGSLLYLLKTSLLPGTQVLGKHYQK